MRFFNGMTGALKLDIADRAWLTEQLITLVRQLDPAWELIDDDSARLLGQPGPWGSMPTAAAPAISG